MKIKIFDSTALACSLLREAIEMHLGFPVRYGEHAIEFIAVPNTLVKIVNINGVFITCDGDRIQAKAIVFVDRQKDSGTFTGTVCGHVILTFNGHQRVNLFFRLKPDMKIECSSLGT